MTLAQLCWLSTAACALHIFEEAVFDWRAWATSLTGIPISLEFFYAGNAMALILAIVASVLAPTLPAFALALPVVLLINATVFHLLPCLFTRGRFSPGLLTAIFLFWPLGIQTLRTAARNHSIPRHDYALATLIALAFITTPILFLRLTSNPYFRQPR